MANNTANATVQIGPGVFGLLTLIFVVAKLTGVIDWSWYLVFAPLLVVPLLVLFIFLLIFGAACLGAALNDR